jgi:hypothetical protein
VFPTTSPTTCFAELNCVSYGVPIETGLREIEKVRLQVGQTRTLDIKLEVGATAERVEGQGLLRTLSNGVPPAAASTSYRRGPGANEDHRDPDCSLSDAKTRSTKYSLIGQSSRSAGVAGERLIICSVVISVESMRSNC